MSWVGCDLSENGKPRNTNNLCHEQGFALLAELKATLRVGMEISGTLLSFDPILEQIAESAKAQRLCLG